MWFLKELFMQSRFSKLTFKMRNTCQSYQQECREAIKEEVLEITKSLPAIKTRLKLKDAKDAMHQHFKDIFGYPKEVKKPIFTEDELSKYTQNLNSYRIVLFLMLFFESVLYSLMASLFMRRQSLQDYAGIEYIFGFAFAIIFVAALHFAYKNMWEFFEAKYLIELNDYDKKLLKPFYINIVISVIIFAVFIVTNIYTGYIRAIIIEPSSTSTSSFLEKIHGPILVFSIAITFIVALVMALLEKEITDKSIKYKVYKNWKRQQKERKEYNTQVKDMTKKCRERKELLIEKYWGITLDAQRIYKSEVDQDRSKLYNELQDNLSSGSVKLYDLDDSVYQKYTDVAMTRLELFRYAVDSDKGINESLKDLFDLVSQIEEFETQNSITDGVSDD